MEASAATAVLPPGRSRRPGAGRTRITGRDPQLVDALERMIEPHTRGGPDAPLRWIGESTQTLAAPLTRPRHLTSHEKVAQVRRAQDYSGHSARKTEEGEAHPDRDAPCRSLKARGTRALAAGTPVVSVDTKQKAWIGHDAKAGRRWRPAKAPVTVSGHACPDPSVPRADTDGVSDIGRHTGVVTVGTDQDTGVVAVESRLATRGPEGVSGCARTGHHGRAWRPQRIARVWTLSVQALADDTGLPLSVCCFPPGTSQWNTVAHRVFSFISSNWRGEPLRDDETMGNLMARTTAKGLTVPCRRDCRKYPTGRKVTDEALRRVNLERHTLHGEWKDTIRPQSR